MTADPKSNTLLAAFAETIEYLLEQDTLVLPA
jgi:hypothetical protein